MFKTAEAVSPYRCRVCLASGEEMYNIFEDEATSYKLQLCCGVDIVNTESWPSYICKKCLDILNVAYEFRLLCQRSHEYLSNHKVKFNDGVKSDAPESDMEYPPTEHDNEAIPQDDKSFHQEFENRSENTESPVYTETNSNEEYDNGFKGRAACKQKLPASFMCSICGNMYKLKTTFNYHMKLHHKDKKYECEICGKRFMQTCELRAHIRIHTGEKPFKCSYCNRHFRDRSGVTRHERTHTNERPYGCTICGAQFSYSVTLKKHERVHTGEKPFKCIICVKQFSEAHQLKAHLATLRHKYVADETKVI